MKFWQCSICGKVGLWGPTWRSFSSLLIDEEFPSHRVVTCASACEEKAERGHENGTIDLPKISCRGYAVRMTRGPKGYKPQPEQRELLRIWNKENPDHQVSTAFTS